MPLRTDDNWRHGAVLLDSDHTRFALWAPDAEYVSVELQDGQSLAMLPQPEGWFVVDASCKAGTRYRFKINHELEVPDPASRAQAGDVHAHSVVVDPAYSRKTPNGKVALGTRQSSMSCTWVLWVATQASNNTCRVSQPLASRQSS